MLCLCFYMRVYEFLYHTNVCAFGCVEEIEERINPRETDLPTAVENFLHISFAVCCSLLFFLLNQRLGRCHFSFLSVFMSVCISKFSYLFSLKLGSFVVECFTTMSAGISGVNFLPKSTNRLIDT
jgi:hypothetical protein